MPKQRQGWVKKSNRDGRWRAGVTYVDRKGKRHWINRLVETKTEGKTLLKDLLRKLEDHGAEPLLNARVTFDVLADRFEEDILVEPLYVDGRKVAGLRTSGDLKLKLRVLRDYFGAMKVCDITPSDLQKFKTHRLKTPKRPRMLNGKKVPGGQRSIASVNRELALLRRVFNYAIERGVVTRNPFTRRSLISVADERKRERILTRVEEKRLLAACDTPRRIHLRPIVICALDTGMRRGEILKLCWSDVDFATSTLTIRAFNTKTMRERRLVMTARMKRTLEAVYELSSKDPNALCFGVEDNVKKAFTSARKAAGLPDVRFHDLRHTAATRLIAAGLSLAEVGRILGHTTPATTFRYVNMTGETARRAAELFDQFNTRSDEEDGERETVN